MVGRYLLVALCSAATVSACGQQPEVPADPPPVAEEVAATAFEFAPAAPITHIGEYRIGSAIADLYNGRQVCFDISISDRKCDSIETLVERSATSLRIMRFTSGYTSQDCDTPANCLAGIFRGTGLNPEGYEQESFQTLDIVADGFCRTKEQAVSDALMTNAKWVVDFDSFFKYQDYTSGELRDLRERRAASARRRLGSVVCVKYRQDPAAETDAAFFEDVFIDGIKQPAEQTSHVTFGAPGGAFSVRLR